MTNATWTAPRTYLAERLNMTAAAQELRPATDPGRRHMLVHQVDVTLVDADHLEVAPYLAEQPATRRGACAPQPRLATLRRRRYVEVLQE